MIKEEAYGIVLADLIQIPSIKGMLKEEVYKFVLRDLKQVPMFSGIYDASHGDDKYMYGIWAVMEAIAHGAGGQVYEEFDKMFASNLSESEKRVADND